MNLEMGLLKRGQASLELEWHLVRSFEVYGELLGLFGACTTSRYLFVALVGLNHAWDELGGSWNKS